MKTKNAQLRVDLIALNSLLDDASITTVEKILFLKIASRDWGGEKGICKMTIQDIATHLSCSKVSAQRYMKRLANQGYIQHIYRVQLPDSTIRKTTSWQKARTMNQEGRMLRAFYKVTKHGFYVRSKPQKQT